MAERIVVGSPSAPLFTFTNADLIDCKCVLTSSLSGDELAIDQFMPVVYSASYIRVGFVPVGSTGLITADGMKFMVLPGANHVDKIPYGTEIRYYSNNNLVGKFYSQRVIRSGKTRFDILAVSAIGVLDNQQHLGGIYTGETFNNVVADIIGGSFAFSCDADVASINVYGWLPIASRRSNLHQLLFATGVALYKGNDGNIVFKFPNSANVKNIPDNRIFYGGQVNYQSPASRAEVVEHTFTSLASDVEETLFENVGGEYANRAFISFSNAPIHDIMASSGLTIHESGVNYAIVSGNGTLYGKPYTHITRVISKGSDYESAYDKTVSVTNATLVSVANSENVLGRIISYYSSAKIIRNSIVLNGESPGDQVNFSSPYNEPENAYISNMEINASSFTRASCEMITGYVPSGGGNNYKRVEILTGSGTWTSPITGKIRVAVIQGGSGGSGGHRGTDGEGTELDFEKGRDNPRRTCYTSENVGIGGIPGSPGSAGKVFIVSLNVSAGQTFAFNSGDAGVGGSGETKTSEAFDGTEGGETTFGQYSSANGAIVSGGYLDIINNVLYAAVGDSGSAGENGFVGGQTELSYGFAKQDNLRAANSSGRWYRTYVENDWLSGGGGQGGYAFGVAGELGEVQENKYAEYKAERVNDPHYFKGSYGGNGATPINAANAVNIGCGGQGGHGGGGGGTGGSVYASLLNWNSAALYTVGGKGGNGGRGGNGAPGGIVIYM